MSYSFVISGTNAVGNQIPEGAGPAPSGGIGEVDTPRHVLVRPEAEPSDAFGSNLNSCLNPPRAKAPGESSYLQGEV